MTKNKTFSLSKTLVNSVCSVVSVCICCFCCLCCSTMLLAKILSYLFVVVPHFPDLVVPFLLVILINYNSRLFVIDREKVECRLVPIFFEFFLQFACTNEYMTVFGNKFYVSTLFVVINFATFLINAMLEPFTLSQL